MDTEKNKYYYKYRSINENDLGNDRALNALFGSYSVFSSRILFNDLFDSKINFNRPTTSELNLITREALRINKKKYKILCECVNNGIVTAKGERFLKEHEVVLNQMIDKYCFYCVSTKCTSNLMWAHYANLHRGFCIEFRADYIPAQKVIYQKDIAEIELSDLIRMQVYSEMQDVFQIGNKIRNALLIKLEEWAYEDEWRLHLSSDLDSINLKNGYKNVQYTSNFVESIIFGCRTPGKIKQYIVDNMPYQVKYKEAVERKSVIEIIDSVLYSF
jgi:hypothetical protein